MSTLLGRDLFTDANGTLLSAHVPDFGFVGWQGQTRHIIQSNKLRFVQDTAGIDYPAIATHDFVTSDDVAVILRGVTVTGAITLGEPARIGAILKATNTTLVDGSKTMYAGASMFYSSEDGNLHFSGFWYGIQAPSTDLGAAAGGNAATIPLAATFNLKFRMHGDKLGIYLDADNDGVFEYTLAIFTIPSPLSGTTGYGYKGLFFGGQAGQFDVASIDFVACKPATRLAFLDQPSDSVAAQVFTCSVIAYDEDDDPTEFLDEVVMGFEDNPCVGVLDSSYDGSPPTTTPEDTDFTHAVMHSIVNWLDLFTTTACVNYTLLATCGSVTGVSDPFTVTAGVFDHITFGQQPPAVAVTGHVISPAVVVWAVDQYGNHTQLAAGFDITIGLGVNPSGAALTGTIDRSPVPDGTWTFDDLVIDKDGVGYTLLADVGPVESDAFTTRTPAWSAAAAPGDTPWTAPALIDSPWSAP